MGRPRAAAGALLVALALATAPAEASPKPPFTATPGPDRAELTARDGQRARAAAASTRRRPRVKAPKSGEYKGAGGTLALYVSGKSIDLAAFAFDCGAATGRTSLNAIPLKRTKRGYRFAIKANGNVTYSDSHADENASVAIKGRFARNGKTVSGTFRVDSPRCADTGDVRWHARR
jgi:hypothetical protein